MRVPGACGRGTARMAASDCSAAMRTIGTSGNSADCRTSRARGRQPRSVSQSIDKLCTSRIIALKGETVRRRNLTITKPGKLRQVCQ